MVLYDVFMDLDIFVLIMLRITAFIFLSPLFGRNEIPAIVKITVSVFLAYTIMIADIPVLTSNVDNVIAYVFMCISEVLRGMLIGFMSSVFFSLFMSAGKVIDTKLGFQMSEVFDPIYGVKTTISGNFLSIAAFVVFLLLNGHLHMIRILMDSYISAPLGQAVSFEGIFEIFISAFSLAFLISVKIALPVIIVILISEAVMGMLIKFIPQMNIFIVGMPLKILIGVFALFFMIVPLMGLFEDVFELVFTYASSLN